jgi:hypothetical protein
MVSPRADFPVVTLSDGTLLITGGFAAPSSITNAEIYYPGAAPIQIVATTLANAVTVNGFPGTAPPIQYSAQIQTIGGAGGALTFSVVSGALPSSITLNPATGALTSSSVTDPAGPYNFTIQAVSAGPPSSTATQAFTLTLVVDMAGATPNTLPAGTAGVAYSQSLNSVGGTPPITYQFSSGTLPPGLNITTPGATGLLNGTPTSAGSFAFVFQATDSSTPAQQYVESVTLNIAPQPPTNLSASQVPGAVLASLTWTPSVSNGLTGYNIYRGNTPSGPFTLVGTAGAAATGFIDSTVAVATYYYEVTAVASGGVESVVSNVAPVTIP